MTKLRAVSANFEFQQIFQQIPMFLWIHSFKKKSVSLREVICENEFLRENILICLSGAHMGSIHEKNAKKSRDTAP